MGRHEGARGRKDARSTDSRCRPLAAACACRFGDRRRRSCPLVAGGCEFEFSGEVAQRPDEGRAVDGVHDARVGADIFPRERVCGYGVDSVAVVGRIAAVFLGGCGGTASSGVVHGSGPPSSPS